jgi:hypothetical protein
MLSMSEGAMGEVAGSLGEKSSRKIWKKTLATSGKIHEKTMKNPWKIHGNIWLGFFG